VPKAGVRGADTRRGGDVRKAFLAVAAIAVGAILGTTGTALANGRDHFGPFPSGSPDSGTCGNFWATDTFDRVYKVDPTPSADGTYTVREEFKNGTFITNGGPSPGACETNTGGTVLPGVTGKMHGYFTIVVSGGTYDPDAVCPPGCFTAAFVAAFFGPTATFDIPTFSFQYSAADQGLCLRHWKNASADRGGNSGDIAHTCS
jgi:hypothetical protein